MKIHPVNLLLLAGILFWGTGQGRFLHDRFQHSALKAAHPPAERIDAPQHNGHSLQLAGHPAGQCLVCKMLGTMKAGPLAACVPPPAPGLLLELSSDAPDCPPLLFTTLSKSARGPPSAFQGSVYPERRLFG